MTIGVYSSWPHILGAETGTLSEFPLAEFDMPFCRIATHGIMDATRIIAIAAARLLNVRQLAGVSFWGAGISGCAALRFVEFIVCSNPAVMAAGEVSGRSALK